MQLSVFLHLIGFRGRCVGIETAQVSELFALFYCCRYADNFLPKALSVGSIRYAFTWSCTRKIIQWYKKSYIIIQCNFHFTRVSFFWFICATIPGLLPPVPLQDKIWNYLREVGLIICRFKWLLRIIRELEHLHHHETLVLISHKD